MIMPWNRKEVYNGYSMKAFNEIKESLISNRIKYTTRIINSKNPKLFGPSRSYTGSFGEKTEFTYEYYIYVHKDDYEKVMWLLKK